MVHGGAQRHVRIVVEARRILQVETVDTRRAGSLVEARHGIQAHQLPIGRAQENLAQVGGRLEGAVRRLQTHVIALAIARVVVPLGDVHAAREHIGRQRHVAAGQPQRGGARAVNVDFQFRHVQQQIQIDEPETGYLRQARTHQFGVLADFLQVRTAHGELQLLAALATDGRRGHRECPHTRQGRELGPQLQEHVLLADVALGQRLHGHEHHALVGLGSGEQPHRAKGVLDHRLRVQDVLDQFHARAGVLDTGTERRLEDHHETAFVLVRHEFLAQCAKEKHTAGHHQHGHGNHRPAAPQAGIQQSLVSPVHALEEAAEGSVKTAVAGTDVQIARAQHRRQRQRHEP